MVIIAHNLLRFGMQEAARKGGKKSMEQTPKASPP
jgi:hypothetical protein